MTLRRRRRPNVVPKRRKSDDPSLALDRALMQLLPKEDIATSARLVPALRAAGFDAATAQSIASVRDAVQGYRYGPPGRGITPDALALEQALGWLRDAMASRPSGVVALLLLCVVSLSPAQASPDSLYAAGALSRAEEGFQGAIATSPRDPALWYGLGASRYRQGDDGGAAAAWITALRLAPRDGTIRRALLLTPPPDQASAARRSVPPFTAAELLLVAGICWLAGWGLLLVSERKVRRFAPVLLVLGVVVGIAAGATYWWDRRPIALAVSDTPLRTSPHGRATAIRMLPSGSAVFVEREQSGWVLVRGAGKELGWLPRSAIAPAGE
jgi:tetratricopeptide (TPR) repeat protein